MGLMEPECETFVTFEIAITGLESLQNCADTAHKCPNFPGPGAYWLVAHNLAYDSQNRILRQEPHLEE